VPERLKKMEGKDLTEITETTPAVQNILIASTESKPESVADGVSSAVSAERSRMKALDALLIPGAEDIIARAKYETGASPEQVALEIIKAHIATGAIALKERLTDANESGVNNINVLNNGAWFEKNTNTERAKAIKEAIEKGREVK
jgi:hypothetical protein